MSKLKKNDEVVVIAGKDKGRRGTVTRVLDRGRIYVSGVNMIKGHTKGNPQAGQPGGIIDKEASIDVSNVAIFNSATKKRDRIGYKILEGGEKVRIYKSTGEQIDN